MDIVSYVIGIAALIAIFLFSIHKFSRQVERVAGPALKKVLHSLTKTPGRGVLVGTVVTACVQSSTATTVLTVGLLDAGLLSFYQSLGLIFGANIGSAVFSQLIALEVSNIAPYIVVIGAIMAYFGKAFGWGKVVFYFGMTFFSITLIGSYIEPLASDPSVVQFFGSVSNLYVAILVGAVFTAVIQSSAITSGLVILATGLGVIDFTQAIGFIFGANIGTTVTALIASIHMNAAARKAAIAHFLFNIISVAIFLPFLSHFISFIQGIGGDIEREVANAHMITNVVTAMLAVIFVKPFAKLVEISYQGLLWLRRKKV